MRHNMMRYTYMVVMLDFLITGIDSTICTDKADSDGFTNVLTMCRGGTLTAGRVVVDTYDTGKLDLDFCRCTVRLSGDNTGPVNLEITAYPGTASASECGSRLSFNRAPSNTYREYMCQGITGDIISDFTNNERLDISLTRAVRKIQWRSGYCILIQSGVNVNITCEAASGLLTTSSTTSAPTTTTTTTTPTPTTTPILTTTDDVTTGYCNCDQTAVPLVAVVVLIVVTLLVVALATVANVILYKRRLPLVTELNSGTHGMTSSDAVHYDSIDKARVEPPNTYEEMSTGQTYVNTAMET